MGAPARRVETYRGWAHRRRGDVRPYIPSSTLSPSQEHMLHKRYLCLSILILMALLSLAACSRPSHPSVDVRPVPATAPVSEDPDDPAVWVHPSDPAQSLIVGTNKVAAPNGALVVFGPDGKARQTIAGLDRPNNVDVEYGLLVGGQPTDIAVVTERMKNRLRVFRIPRDGGPLTDISPGGGAPVLEGETGERAEPMGIALDRRPCDGAVFAIISPKTGRPRRRQVPKSSLAEANGVAALRISLDATTSFKTNRPVEFRQT